MQDEAKHKDELIAELAAQRKKIQKLEALTTRYMQLEPALQENARAFQSVLKALTDHIWSADIIDNQIIYRYFSPIVERMVGYSATHFVEGVNAWLKIVHPDHQAALRDALKQALQGEIVSIDYRIVHPNGDVRWLAETITPTCSNESKQVIRLDGVIADVTASKQAEAHLKQHMQELMLFNSVIAAASSAQDEHLILETVCQKLTYGLELNRVTVAEMNRDKSVATIITESRSEHVPSILHQTIPVTNNSILSHIIIHKAPLAFSDALTDVRLVSIKHLLNLEDTQSILFVPLTIKDDVIAVIILENGHQKFSTNDLSFLWNVADQIALNLEKTRLFTQAREAYEILRQTQARLIQSEKMSALGQLSAGIAHDFNNILTSIIGFAELASRHPDVPETMKVNQERIVQQGLRGAHLIRQILDFSHKTIAQKESLDFVLFLKETIRLLEHTIPENIQLILTIEPGAYRVNADAVQIQQALTNLAINARDAMPNGGSIRFRLNRIFIASEGTLSDPQIPPGEWLVISVQDNGSGIPKAALPHIFEPFFTTKDVGKGSGLGLAQVYGLIRQHEGHIKVDSEEGVGTTFTLYLPLLSTTTKELTEHPPQDLPQGAGETVLLVEDEPVVLKVVKDILENLDYQVLTATNGQEALQVYEAHHAQINLVLTDLTMPEMGGIALTRALRERDPDIKVVALTGYPLEAADKQQLHNNVVDWMQKPVNIVQLAQTIKRTLRK